MSTEERLGRVRIPTTILGVEVSQGLQAFLFTKGALNLCARILGCAPRDIFGSLGREIGGVIRHLAARGYVTGLANARIE